MNDLEEYFRSNKGNLIDKWSHYFAIYERHFGRFKNKPVVLLEIGVFQGESLRMWKYYFNNDTKIYGIDNDLRCKEFEEENIEIFIGSQSDRNFLREITQKIPRIDILIDDGGHTMMQQKISFEELFDHIKDDGIYLCEDLHTSYWLKYGGGYKRKGTFIEYSKNLIDHLNAFHSEQKKFKVNKFTTTVSSIHFYDSVIVIEKSLRKRPVRETSGYNKWSIDPIKYSLYAKTRKKLKKNFHKILRFFNVPASHIM